METLILGSDHGGFAVKEHLITWLTERGYQVEDCGATAYDENDDYPVFAAAVARLVSADSTSRGILLCRSGQGVTIVANKFPHVRAALAWTPEVALAARRDDDANILCLAADYTNQVTIESIVEAWLHGSLQSGDKYAQRLREINQIEEETMRK